VALALLPLVLASTAVVAPVAGQQASQPLPVTEAPAEWRAAIGRAQKAFAEVQSVLKARLDAEMKAGGPVAAVRVCRDEAQALTAGVARDQRFEVGRTSHKLRNPSNAPRAWALSTVASHAGVKATAVTPVVVDLGDRLGVLGPIPTGEVCVVCHGAEATLPPPIAAAIRDAYPADRATGFAPGDLRGWMWAEVTR
jgi:Protein of unknown function (DUF3365)